MLHFFMLDQLNLYEILLPWYSNRDKMQSDIASESFKNHVCLSHCILC